MPKKQPQNAYYFFMLDYKKEQEALGRKFNGGLRDVAEECSVKWKELPQSVRQRYEKKAKDAKTNGPAAIKYTAQGERLDQVLARQKEIEDVEHMKKEAVHRMVFNSDDVINETFFLIDVNYYCQTKELFVINEVAVVAFSVQEGLQLVFHKIIDPVTIPMGFMLAAKQSAEEHCFGIPPLDNVDSTSDLVQVLSELLDFIHHILGDDSGPYAFFTYEDRTQPVQSFLYQLSADYDDESQFKLYPLSVLFYELTQKLSRARNEALPKVTLASIALSQDKFQYSAGLACDFHEETNMFYNCVKSRTKRWAYTILDHVCPLAGVEMASGDHVPQDVDPEEASRIKAERDEAWEEEQRREREREANKSFTVVDYGAQPQRQQWSCSTPASTVCDNSWPSLGGSRSRTPVSVAPLGVWSVPSPSSAAPPPSSSGSAAAPPKRAPLKKPGFDLASMMVGCAEIGIGRGRGRGSVASLNSDI